MSYKRLVDIRARDPLDQLGEILFSFIDEGFVKELALSHFQRHKPRVRTIIQSNKTALINLIERI